MSKLQYALYKDSISVITAAGELISVLSDNPNFERISNAFGKDAGLAAEDRMGDREFFELLHYVPVAPEVKMARLSGRILYDASNDTILFDGVPVDSTLTEYIKELVKTDHPQLNAFVNFMERLATNPSEEARNDLYNWIKTLQDRGEKLTISAEGKLLAYKGVMIDGDGDPASINVGPGIVDGYSVNGHLKNKVGSIVEVSRDYVDANNLIGCSRGLHAGTYSYASGFACGLLLLVEIDPADVVSVPAHCAWQKIRCCRYRVIETIVEAKVLPVLRGSGADWTALDLELWESTGFSIADSKVYRERGYTIEEALEIETSDESINDSYSMAQWMELGFSLPEVVTLRAAGVSYGDASTDNFDESLLDSEDDDDDYGNYDYDEDDEDDYDEEAEEEELRRLQEAAVEAEEKVRRKAAKKAAKKAKAKAKLAKDNLVV